MAKFSTDGAGSHETGPLGMSGSGSVTKGADILRALRTDVFGGLALEAPYHSGGGGFRVRDDNGISAGSGFHNHLQSSRECNTSSAHSRRTLSLNPSPASLSQRRVVMISFPCGKGGGSGVARERVSSSGQLGRWVDGGVGGGQGFGRGGRSGGAWRAWIGPRVGGWTSILLITLHFSLHRAISHVIHSPLLLQE